MKKKWSCVAVLLTLSMTACAGGVTARHDLATSIAAPAGFVEQVGVAGNFTMTRFVRTGRLHAPATVYVEGDGLAWLSRSEPSLNPTPTDPIALRLAALDPAANVIYLARPCQYTARTGDMACDQAYWTDKRFAPEIIAAMNAELDQLKRQYQWTGINLVGFSGGGAVVALLAERRDDILSLRAVAGNLDPALFSRLHHVSPLTGSLDPITDAPRLARLPQHYFVGGADQIVPPVIAASFLTAVGLSSCIRITTLPGVMHDKGWVEAWPDLLKTPLDCNVP